MEDESSKREREIEMGYKDVRERRWRWNGGGGSRVSGPCLAAKKKNEEEGGGSL